MKMCGPEILEPVFHWLDRLIHDHGDILYMGLVYVSIPLIVWILSGGLRRKRPTPQPHTHIILIQPPARPPQLPPPIIGGEQDTSGDDDSDSFAA
jgi:hypothetical protein